MRLLDFIICDDIRNELGNKVSLMGIYTGTYIIPGNIVKWPFPTRFGFFIRLLLEGEQPGHEFEFHIMRLGETKVKVDGLIQDIDPGKPFIIHFNLSPFFIKEAGTLDFEIRFLKGAAPISIPLSSLEIIGVASESDPRSHAGSIPVQPVLT
jgi:hypothetical protein